MNRLQNQLYQEDLEKLARLPLPWENLDNKTVVITGASGMIGTFLIDVLMVLNKKWKIKVISVGKTLENLKNRFADYLGNPCFTLVVQDVTAAFCDELKTINADYVFHLAGNTHPVAYASDPIGTITANIIGLKNILDYAVSCDSERVLYASSVEIYGNNRGDVEYFSEDYCGYINCNTLRAGYPESKRGGEALCQAYIRQKKVDVVICRLSRIYGATMLPIDTKASSQFIQKAVVGDDIVLKSDGSQAYSYLYVADAVVGMLYVLFFGDVGEAYNIADKKSDITLREFATYCAMLAESKVVFDVPSNIEKMGYSTATKALLDAGKLRKLGFESTYDACAGISRTVSILKEVYKI